ncbi:MAG: hypothetical protein JXA93_23940, partial [Anaerolineae bacterium]|nr:hypothetical protein [Anaerolineae bacterium]
MTDKREQYNIAAIRRLLQEAFTAGDLGRFCLDRPAFRFLLDHFGPGFSFLQMIDAVLEQCLTRDLLPDLLAAVREVNPRHYERHGPYVLPEGEWLAGGALSQSTPYVVEKSITPIPAAPAPPPHFVDREVELGQLAAYLTMDTAA